MYALSRSRTKSWIAHNLIPFWQPGISPLDNLARNSIMEKYRQVNQLKNHYFKQIYGDNPNYTRIEMNHLFEPGRIEGLIWNFFGFKIAIPVHELMKRSNESRSLNNQC